MKQYNFKNLDDFKILEKQAYTGAIDVSNFPPPEYKYFDMLRKIYYDFKFNGLPQDTAEKYKCMIYAEYQSYLSTYDNWCNVYKEYQDNIRKVGTLRNDIEKAITAEDIAIKACEVIQLLTGEMSFLERQTKKFKEEIS